MRLGLTECSDQLVQRGLLDQKGVVALVGFQPVQPGVWQGVGQTLLIGWQPPERFALRLELPVATADTGASLFVSRRALAQLGQWLTIRDQALTRLRLRLEREEGGGNPL